MCGVFAMLPPIGVMAPLLVAAMVCLGLGSGAAIGESIAFDELEDQALRAVDLLEAINGGDVWMI